jgi:hypothetical protein
MVSQEVCNVYHGLNKAGQKYIVQGMLFKFYLDVKMAPGAWLYGGKVKNTEKGKNVIHFL